MEALLQEQRGHRRRRLISLDGLRAKGITHSKAQTWRKIKAGKFPRPVSGAVREAAWVEEEIDQHVESLIAGRDRGAGHG